MKKVCVFCGSSGGHNSIYKEEAIKLGELIVEEGMELVYGGGNIGIMGIIADTVLDKGGIVTGVIPHFLAKKEVGHTGLSEMIFVDSMHERKQKMSELADAFIALPGGFGTLEELSEIITWAQLGLVTKPIGILNTNNYFQALLQQFDVMVSEGFLKIVNRKRIIAEKDVRGLLNQMKMYVPEVIPKWISPDET